ncbi:hypothetical protein EYV94_07565 [Puteibacter caeruleilacunae]|nr:hypothetical protein EYV94_07565 [Puteibacter caeruleilacunae]
MKNLDDHKDLIEDVLDEALSQPMEFKFDDEFTRNLMKRADTIHTWRMYMREFLWLLAYLTVFVALSFVAGYVFDKKIWGVFLEGIHSYAGIIICGVLLIVAVMFIDQVVLRYYYKKYTTRD